MTSGRERLIKRAGFYPAGAGTSIVAAAMAVMVTEPASSARFPVPGVAGAHKKSAAAS